MINFSLAFPSPSSVSFSLSFYWSFSAPFSLSSSVSLCHSLRPFLSPFRCPFRCPSLGYFLSPLLRPFRCSFLCHIGVPLFALFFVLVTVPFLVILLVPFLVLFCVLFFVSSPPSGRSFRCSVVSRSSLIATSFTYNSFGFIHWRRSKPVVQGAAFL